VTVAGALATSHLLTGSRLAGVDLARGLAVLGMLSAHLLAIEAFDPDAPETWIDIVNGRSSILFAVLAGVSLALISGGATPVDGERLRIVRGRTAVRSAVLWTIGIALIVTGVPVYVILPAYAILFLLALPFLRLRAPALWTIAAALALTMPLLQPALNEIVARAGADVELMLGEEFAKLTLADKRAYIRSIDMAARIDMRSNASMLADYEKLLAE
jgi:uncharacterized membrane protein